MAPICFALSLKACSSSPDAPDTAATFDMPSSKSMPTFSAMPATPAAASDRYFILPAALVTLFPKFVMLVDSLPIRDWLAIHSICSFFSCSTFIFASSASRSSFLYAAEERSTPEACACASALFSCCCFSSASLTFFAKSCVFCEASATLFGFIRISVLMPRSSLCAFLASPFSFRNAWSSFVVRASKSISMPLIITMQIYPFANASKSSCVASRVKPFASFALSLNMSKTMPTVSRSRSPMFIPA